jgi:cobyrinic acid a,c-diamide synthase
MSSRLEIAGVILNHVASARHEMLARSGFGKIAMPVFGAIPRNAAIALPLRHLGLVQATELEGLSVVSMPSAISATPISTSMYFIMLCLPQISPGRTRIESARWEDAYPGLPIGKTASRDAFCHQAKGLHLQDILHSRSSTLICSKPGAAAALKSSHSRRWPASRLPGRPMLYGYPAAIPSCMRAGSPPIRPSHTGMHKFAAPGAVHGECGGYRCLEKGSSTRKASGMVNRAGDEFCSSKASPWLSRGRASMRLRTRWARFRFCRARVPLCLHPIGGGRALIPHQRCKRIASGFSRLAEW